MSKFSMLSRSRFFLKNLRDVVRRKTPAIKITDKSVIASEFEIDIIQKAVLKINQKTNLKQSEIISKFINDYIKLKLNLESLNIDAKITIIRNISYIYILTKNYFDKITKKYKIDKIRQLCFQCDQMYWSCSFYEKIQNSREIRSYVDAQLAATIIGQIFEEVATAHRQPRLSATLVDDLLVNDASQRSLWLLKGRYALEDGDADLAITAAEAALRLNAVCPDSQRLLLDALILRRSRGLDGSHPDFGRADLSGRFCSRPFTTLVTGFAGKTFLCDCPAYLPFETGNVLKDANAEALWNGPAAQEIRRSILDEDFSYCSRMLCGLIKQDALPLASDVTDPTLREIIDTRRLVLADGPREIQLSHDQSCNLACPSCRTEIITLKGSEQAPFDAALQRTVLPLLQQTNGTLMISGGGDPFASKHYRSILASLDAKNFEGLNISILTNGLLLTPSQWEMMAKAHELIGSVLVSVDAARAETYADVRRPGTFARLIPNLKFITELRIKGEILVFGLCFVVQKKNFREMPEFVALGKSLGADVIWFQRIVNFGSFSSHEIFEADVALVDHPDHAEFLEILGQPMMKDPVVQIFGSYLADRVQSPGDSQKAIKGMKDYKRMLKNLAERGQ